MRFDAYAVLAGLRAEGGAGANRATCANSQPAISTFSTVQPNESAEPDLAAASTTSTFSTAPAPGFKNVIPLPPRIAAAVTEAFKDHEATDDPFNPRAWSGHHYRPAHVTPLKTNAPDDAK